MSMTQEEGSGGPMTEPPQPPRLSFRSRRLRIGLLLLSPFVSIFLVVWYVVGSLLTLPAIAPVVACNAAVWVVFCTAKEVYTSTLDLPIVFTCLTVGTLLFRKRGRGTRLACFGSFFAITVHAIIRLCVTDVVQDSSSLTAVAVVEIVGSLWIAVCACRLWLSADLWKLEAAERALYEQYVNSPFEMSVVAGLGTVKVPYCGDVGRQMPQRNLVLVHGYFAGNGYWAANLQQLAKCCNVYLVEWKGIGRSDRPKFRPKTEKEMDDFFVEPLEDWRKAMGLERFVLCGHSMGAMFCTYYAESYPQYVEHLILASPAGVRASDTPSSDLPLVIRLGALGYVTPMSLVRFAGPLGERLVRFLLRARSKYTPDTNVIRNGEMNFDDISRYSYHNWALDPSGDIAVYTHLRPGARAHHRSLTELLTPVKFHLPLTVLYGGGSDWMFTPDGEEIVRKLEKSQYAGYKLVPLAGHHIFMDNPQGFNQTILDAVWEHEKAQSEASHQGSR